MKRMNIKYIGLIAGMIMTLSSCADLLNQEPTVDLPSSNYWKTESDAESALNGLVSDIRWLFNRDYYLDGMGEFVRVRGNSFLDSKGRDGRAYRGLWEISPIGYGGGWSEMYRYCYGGINRANYVIDNVERMIANTSNEKVVKNLESIIGECKLMRALVYFRLITMWGDVPYIDWRVYDNSEVDKLSRTPLVEVKNHILDDLQYAFDKLPEKASVQGRFSQPAALALRGKVKLYWACWNHFGWPELDTFTPSEEEAKKAYKAAAEDFKKVIDDYGLTLFRNGEPGECDELGKADKLPNYYYLFLPTANGDGEFVLAFNHGGTNTGQGDQLMRDLAGRSIENSQCWVSPRFEIADRYQSTVTGEYCAALVKLNPASVPDARTQPNSAVNPESYKNRDYRMKASIMWDYEVCQGLMSKKVTGWVPYIYKMWGSEVTINGETYMSYNTDGTNTGYVFRKFVRNYPGEERADGDFNWPVIRLADVYLMYAEADNAINGPQPYAINLVNKIRHRGNLPPLVSNKTATSEAFFEAIKQERIVELLGEGQRVFDTRRWREIEKVWCEPSGKGVKMYDTYGAQVAEYYVNQNSLAYERCYIFQIPESERNRNPNLTQNKPYR